MHKLLMGLAAVFFVAPTDAHAAITGIEWPEFSPLGGCSAGGGTLQGGAFAGELCYTRPSSAGPGSLAVWATYDKGGSIIGIEASSLVDIRKALPGGFVVYETQVTVTKDGSSYSVPLDATRAELMPVEDIFAAVDAFIYFATTTGSRFNPKTVQTLGWATFPSFYGLQYDTAYPLSFATGATRFDGTLSLCVCDLAEMLGITGTWANGHETTVTGVIVRNDSTGEVVINDLWSDDWLALGNKEWNDDWLAPKLTVRGRDLDDAVTKATRIAVSRSLAVLPE